MCHTIDSQHSTPPGSRKHRLRRKGLRMMETCGGWIQTNMGPYRSWKRYRRTQHRPVQYTPPLSQADRLAGRHAPAAVPRTPTQAEPEL